MQVKKQQLELDMEQQTGSKLGKQYVKAVYCHAAYLTYAEYIMWNARVDESQAGINAAGRKVNNLRYADDGRKQRGTKELLDEGERGKWKKKKTTLNLNIKKLRSWHLVSSLRAK